MMVVSLVKNHMSWLVVVAVVVIAVAQCEGKKCGVICRVRDPLTIGNSQVLKECLYEVYPVESTQNTDGSGYNLFANDDRRNRLFSLYGGPSSCEYFGTMIQTAKGRDTLVETIRRQLQKSGFKGLDLQCDPVQARVTQQTYAEFMEQLRSFLGNTYVVMVTMSNCQLEPRLVETLNRVADFVTINHGGQSSMLSSALMYGLARHRLLLTTPCPAFISCPLNSDHALNEVLSQIEQNHLFGAVVELDRDDVHNQCGEGPFPLLRKVLDRLCSNAECNFSGFVRDTRNCGQFYSCDQGCKKTHFCPPGQSFDVCQSTCQPFLMVNCNSTTCVVSGSLPNGLTPIRFPVPFPNPNANCPMGGGGGNMGGGGGNMGGGGGGNMGGGGGNMGGGGQNQTSNCCCDVLRNLTAFINGTGQFSQFIQFVKDLGADNTAGEIRTALSGVTPLLNNLVQQVTNLLGGVLNGNQMMNNTLNGMNNVSTSAGLVQQLLNVVTTLLNTVLGSVPGGGGAGAGGAPTTGNGTGLALPGPLGAVGTDPLATGTGGLTANGPLGALSAAAAGNLL